MSFLRWDYPEGPQKVGIWGQITSGENYCEEDYIITKYFAEFVNTTTNIAYLIYAWYGVSESTRYPDFWTRALPYIGIAGVGICSAAFHGTVKLYAQWADDLSMFFAAGIIAQRVFSFGKSTMYSRAVAAGVIATLGGVAVYHCLVDTSTVHQAVFVIMLLCISYKTRQLINGRVKSANVRRQMRFMARSGFFGLLLAWAMWGLDNVFCDQFRAFRRQIGLPWGHLFEFHGWWHIITSIAVYNYFVLCEHLTSEAAPEDNIRSSGASAWPVSRSLLDALNAPDSKND